MSNERIELLKNCYILNHSCIIFNLIIFALTSEILLKNSVTRQKKCKVTTAKNLLLMLPSKVKLTCNDR